jgi:type I restriction enzyme, S subunit
MRDDWAEILYKDAVYKISTTKQKLKQKEYSQFGEFPIVDQGQDKIGGYSDDKDRILDCKLPVVVFGDHTKCVKLINFKFIPGADGTKVLEPKQGIEPKYISTLTHVLVHKIKDKGYARHYQHIEKENLPLAPLLEQRAIVKKIEELFSDLDKGIADLKKAQDQLKVYRQAVLKKAFEGELTKEWRDKQTNLPTADELLVQIKEERQKHYEQKIKDWKIAVMEWEKNGKEGKKPTKPTKLKDLTSNEMSNPNDLSIPSEWFCIPLEYLSDFITKGTTPKSSELFADNGDIPFIKVYNLTFNGELDFSINPTYVSAETHKNFLQRSIIYPNDILMNIVGPPLGKVSIVPDTYPEWNMNQAMVRFRPVNSVLPKFLANYLMMDWTIHQVSKKAKATAGQFNLTLQICREITLPVCSIHEQHQIIQEIESRLSVCDKVVESIEESLEKAKALRQSVLKRAFDGTLLSPEEIAKCKAAKDYEPASVLLEKIKAEKKKK